MAGISVSSKGDVRVPNLAGMQGRLADDSGWQDMFVLDASNNMVMKTNLVLSGKTNALSVSDSSTAFTPVASSAAGAITTQSATGFWSRVGPMVYFAFTLTITDVGTGTGDMTLTLPAALPASANNSMDYPLSVHTESVTEASVQLSAKVITNTKTIKFYDVKTNAAADVLDAENGTFQVAGFYFAA